MKRLCFMSLSGQNLGMFIQSCHRSSVRWDLMRCRRRPVPSSHILPASGFIHGWGVTGSCINLNRKTVRSSSPTWVINLSLLTDFFSIRVKHFQSFFFCLLFLFLLFLYNFLFQLTSNWTPSSRSTVLYLYLLHLCIRRKAGNPKWHKSECVIFKLPANPEHLAPTRRRATLSMGVLVSPCQHHESSPPQGEQGGVCVCVFQWVCYGQEVFILEWYSTGPNLWKELL